MVAVPYLSEWLFLKLNIYDSCFVLKGNGLKIFKCLKSIGNWLKQKRSEIPDTLHKAIILQRPLQH